MVATAKTVSILESVQIPKGLRVDRETNTIYGVRILGPESRDLTGKIRRRYSESALQQSAKMFNRMGINTNHPDKRTPRAERAVQDRFAWFESAEYRDGAVYGDIQCLASHDFTPVFMEAAEKNPELFGLSPNSEGAETVRGGIPLVESIERVISVDVVQKPATNKSLFESQESGETQTLAEFIESMLDCPARAGLTAFLESDPLLGAAPMSPLDPLLGGTQAPGANAAPQPTSDQQVKKALRTAAVAILDDETLDSKATLAKLKAILTATDNITGAGASNSKEEPVSTNKDEAKAGEETPAAPVAAKAGEATPAVDKSKMESMEAENRELKEKDAVRSLMESAGVASTSARVAALVPLNEQDRTSLIEDFKRSDIKTKKPKSFPLLESASDPLDEKEIPSGPKEFADFIRR